MFLLIFFFLCQASFLAERTFQEVCYLVLKLHKSQDTWCDLKREEHKWSEVGATIAKQSREQIAKAEEEASAKVAKEEK